MTELDFSEPKCVFQAFDNISEKNPDLSQRDALDMAYKWCDQRKSDFNEGIDFDCKIYHDLVHPIAEEIVYLEATIDHCNWIVEDIEDFITQDVYGKDKKRAQTEPARQGKKAKSNTLKSAAAKRTPLAQSLSKTYGPGIFEVGSPDNYVKVMGQLMPMPTLSNGVESFKGRASIGNLPMTPVASSVVQGRAVRGSHLYVKFHNSPGEVYKYNMGSEELAVQAFDEMAESSPGRWIWNNVRGKTKGPVFGKPSKQTPGGTTASLVPYDKSRYSRVKRFMNEIPEFEELSAKMRKFKMEVKAQGEGATSGEPFTQEELRKFQDRLRAEIQERTTSIEEIRKMLQQKGLKSVSKLMRDVPEDFSGAHGELREDLDKKVIALRMGENREDHRSKDLVLELLKWRFPTHTRGERQEWWDELLNEVPEISEYVGETKEKDHPENAPKELLFKVAEFIAKNDPIYEKTEMDDNYKYLEGFEDQETPALVMKGINVNAGIESEDLVYNAEVGAIVEGEIIGKNTWGDGDVMVNHEVLYEFDPDDMDEILEGMIRFGEDVFGGFWDQEDLEENYKEEHFNEYTEEWDDDESLDDFKERIKKDQESKSSGKGRGWFGEPERHAAAAKKGSQAKTFKEKGLKKWDLADHVLDMVNTKQQGLSLVAQSLPKIQGLQLVADFITNDYPTDSKGNTDSKGYWITVHGGDDDPETAGTHVFVKKGQSKKEAIDNKFKGKSKGKSEKKEPKSEKKEVKKSDKSPKKPDKDPKKPNKKPEKEVSLEKLFGLPEGVLKHFEPHTIDKFAKKLKEAGKGELPKTKTQLKEEAEKKKEIAKLSKELDKLKKEKSKSAKKPDTPKKDPKKPVKKETKKEVAKKEIKTKKEPIKKELVKKEPKKVEKSVEKKTTKKPNEKKEKTQPKGKKEEKSFWDDFLEELKRRILAEIRRIARDDKKKDFITTDFMPFRRVNDNLRTFGGYITRDDAFLYADGIKYKSWDNIKDIYGNTTHMIAYGSRQQDSHTEANDRFIGFFDTFELVPKGTKGPYKPYIDNDFNRVAAKLHLNKDITEISDLYEDDIFELPVSASYEDLGKGNLQHMTKLYHGAVSLNKNETDRCSTLNGSSCNMSLIRDFKDTHDHSGEVITEPVDIGVSNADISQLPIKKIKSDT